MKECELCSFPARMFCESDQARLCWDCDEKVHGANFLVARHSRSLLCHACQSPTPWKASGSRLAHTVSVCQACVLRCDKEQHRISGEEREQHRISGEERESKGGNTDDEDGDDDDDDDDDVDDEDGGDESDEDDDVEEAEEEDGENQVVPWSSAASPLPPPVTSSSSSEDGEASSRFIARGSGGVSALKRTRHNADLDLDSEDDHGYCSGQQNRKATRTSCEEIDTSLSSLRPWNERQPTEPNRSLKLEDQGETETESTSSAIIGSIKRFQKSMISGGDASAMILGVCKLSKDPRAVDLGPGPTANPTIPTRTV